MEPADQRHVPDGFVPLAKFNDLLVKYGQLQREYASYRRDAEARSVRAAEKIHHAKERIRAWQQYLEKKSAKKAMRDAETGAATTPRALRDGEGPVSLAHPTIEAVRNASVSASDSLMTGKITSSQTTQGEEALPSSPAVDSEDDVPVVVSARSLKRKRETPQGPQPPRIKQEQLSSSPLNSAPYPSLLCTETSDLDVLNGARTRQSQGLRHGTLQRHLLESTRRSPKSGQQVLEQAIDHGSGFVQTPSRVRRTGRPPHAEDVAERCSPDRTPSSNSTVKTVNTDPGANTQPFTSEKAPTRLSRSFGTQGIANHRPSGAPLHEMSPNTPTPTPPRTGATHASSTKPRNPGRSAAALHVLSEDGENVVRNSKRPRTAESDVTPKNRSFARLEHLMGGSSPQVDKTVLSPRSAPSSKARRETVAAASRSAGRPVARPLKTVARTMEKSKPGNSAMQRRSPTDEDSPRANRQTPSDDPGPVLPEHEPLRCLPLHRLNIDSFKVNPNYTDQLGYAYRETVRKRKERLCLPGCTRPECCGAIRRFAEAGGLPDTPRRPALFPDGGPALSDDELTLQGYLGSAYAAVIHSAGEEERRKMLVEARAKAFADRHGKHRQVFERRTTPPGFWRTDMPSTQEMEEDREAAHEMERRKVEERWRDAMRGGGRYLFRDE